MKCILLAGGFATRMYPLTTNFPKPLLPINGKPIITWLMNDLELVESIDEVIVVTNHLFFNKFKKWLTDLDTNKKVILYDTMQIIPNVSFGAVNCIANVYRDLNIDDDTLILAADNVLLFPINNFINYFMQINNSCVMCYEENNSENQKRTGIIIKDSKDKIVKMIEKPKSYVSNIAVPPFYVYKSDLSEEIINAPLIVRNISSPGYLLEELCTKHDIYAFTMPSRRIDLGTIENYNKYKGSGVKFNES